MGGFADNAGCRTIGGLGIFFGDGGVRFVAGQTLQFRETVSQALSVLLGGAESFDQVFGF